MKSRRVAVIGGGLGGLAAAGHLAKQGLSVTLYEATHAVGGKAGTMFERGHILDTGPTLLTMPQVIRETFAALDADDLLPPIGELEVQADYRWENGRTLSTYRDLERTAASAAAMGPGAREDLLRFYTEAAEITRAAGTPWLEAPFEGAFDFIGRVLARGPKAAMTGLKLGTLAQLAERHFRHPELRQFAGRFATYAGLSPFSASAAFAMIPHLEHAHGVHHVEGGIGVLATALAAGVRRLGVNIVTGARTRFEPWGNGFLVSPAEQPEELVDAVVVNADPLSVQPRPGAPLTYSGYVLWLEASQRLSLPHHTLIFSSNDRAEFDALEQGRLADDFTLYVCHPVASAPVSSPRGKSGLFLMVNVPPIPEGTSTDWKDQAQALRTRCLSLLRRRCPELTGIELTVLGERTPVDLARLGAPGGSIYGFAPRGRLGPFRRPRLRGHQRGVFFAGGGTHPGGGVPLVLLSGRFAAGLALEHLGVSG